MHAEASWEGREGDGGRTAGPDDGAAACRYARRIGCQRAGANVGYRGGQATVCVGLDLSRNVSSAGELTLIINNRRRFFSDLPQAMRQEILVG